MGTEDDEREDSLAPVSVERLSVEQEAALMDRGKGSQALLATGLLACLAVVGALWLRGVDEQKLYADLAAASSNVQREHVEAFVHCALTGTPASQVQEGGKLATALESAAARVPGRYGSTLERCARKLGALHADLQAVAAPTELERELRALREAAAGLEAAVLGYADALRRTDAQRDARPSAAGVGEAWNGYADRADLLHLTLLERR